MAIKIAQAVVQIVPSMEGVGTAIKDAFGQAGDSAGKAAGQKIGTGFTKGFDSKLGDIPSDANKAIDKAADGGDTAGQKAGLSFSEAFKKGISAAGDALEGIKGKIKDFAGSIGGILAGAGIGTVVASAISSGLDQANLAGTLKAKLGDTKAAADAAKIAGSVYAEGWGESLDEVADATTALMQQLGQVDKSADFTALTSQAMALANTFEQDVGGMATAAGQMIKTGMVDNAQEAFDVLTVGFQSGANMADDLLDTFTEYPVQFQKLGLDGKTAMGLINQGLQAGARNADLVADAIKEFSIRAVDGSDTTKQGFEALGLSADEMAEKFGQGGKTASDAFELVLQKLSGIEDPVQRSAAAVNLFGTQAEDLGNALYALDPSTAVAALGQIDGAAQKAADNSQNLEMTWQKFVRQVTTSAGGELVPAIESATALVSANSEQMGQTVSTLVGVLGKLVAGFVNLPQPVQVAAASMALFGSKATGIISAATAAGNAIGALTKTLGSTNTGSNMFQSITNGLKTFMSNAGGLTGASNTIKTALTGIGTAFKTLGTAMKANPFAIFITAVAALGAALAVFFTQTETGRAAWQALTSYLQPLWQSVQSAWSAALPAIQQLVQSLGDTIGNIVKAIGPALADFGSNVSTAFGGLITAVGPALASFGQTIAGTFTNVVTAAAPILRQLLNVAQQAFNGLAQAAAPVMETFAQMAPLLIAPIVAQLPALSQAFAQLGEALVAVGQQSAPSIRLLMDTIAQAA
ncbi:phage tail tape measure protein, partial [Bifidobacterium amazonense]